MSEEEWRALPPIQRIQTWGAVTANWPIGLAFQALGQALEAWAIEQQKRPHGIRHEQEPYIGEAKT